MGEVEGEEPARQDGGKDKGGATEMNWERASTVCPLRLFASASERFMHPTSFSMTGLKNTERMASLSLSSTSSNASSLVPRARRLKARHR